MGRCIAVAGLLLATSMALLSRPLFAEQQSPLKVLAKTKGGELSAEIPDRPDWCQPDMTFLIRAQDDAYLTTGEVNERGEQGRFLLQKFLGVIRVGLKQECPQTKSITFNGFVGDTFIYRGYAEKGGAQGDWVLMEMPINLVSAPAVPPPPTADTLPTIPEKILDEHSIEACDALAAHPDDPKKPKSIVGVSDDDLKAGEAAEKCEEALEFAPENLRIKYQLARAYIAYGKAAEGLELMMEAAEEGHAAAIATLGDVALYGVLDDEPDPETAQELYQQAAKLGFKPAAKVAASIEANPKEDPTQAVASEPEYLQPDLAKLTLSGQSVPGTESAFIYNMAYVSSFISGIKYQCEGAGAKGITETRVMEVALNRGGFIPLMALGEGGYAPVQQAGMDDGYALAVTKGCDAKEIRQAEKTFESTFK